MSCLIWSTGYLTSVESLRLHSSSIPGTLNQSVSNEEAFLMRQNIFKSLRPVRLPLTSTSGGLNMLNTFYFKVV